MYIKKPRKKSAKEWSYYAITISCICELIQLYALPRDIFSLVSLTNRILMVVWLAFVGVAVVQKLNQRFPVKMVGILILLIFSVLAYIFAATDNPGTAVGNGLKLLGFFVLPLMLLYSAVFEIDARAKTVVLIFELLVSVVFIDLYYSDKRHIFEGDYEIINIDVITLGYANPNQTAMYLFLCVVCLCTGIFYFKVWWLKLIFAADAACMVWLLWQTGARTATILFFVFAGQILFGGNRKITNGWLNFALLFPVLYVLMIPIGENIMIMGESMFNGRGDIYDLYLGNMTVQLFLFGDMNRFQFKNLHNGYVAIAASVGIPACMGYIYHLKMCLSANRPRSGAPRFEKVAFVGLLCAIMYTCAEATFFTGGSTYAVLIFAVYILFAKPAFLQVGEDKSK